MRAATIRVLDEIAAERRRQIEVEGWMAEHDDTHICGELADAAAAYAMTKDHSEVCENFRCWIWPWSRNWWKPKDRRYDLVRAGALIVAEIERLDRSNSRAKTP